MKLKSLHSLFFVALCSTGLLLSPAKAAADDQAKIYHETDSGAVINVTTGQTIQFALDESEPNTSRWIAMYGDGIAWTNTLNSIQLVNNAVPVFDQSSSPWILKQTAFSYYAANASQSMVVFYKNDIAVNGPTTLVKDENYPLQDSLHPMHKSIIFIVNVNDPTANGAPAANNNSAASTTAEKLLKIIK